MTVDSERDEGRAAEVETSTCGELAHKLMQVLVDHEADHHRRADGISGRLSAERRPRDLFDTLDLVVSARRIVASDRPLDQRLALLLPLLAFAIDTTDPRSTMDLLWQVVRELHQLPFRP